MPTREWYQVAEIFHAPQGEGLFMGRMATFIRLQGCTVGCSWCDTKYTWGRGGTRMTVAEIAPSVKYHHVVITGGEPTLWDLDSLLTSLPKHFSQIETSGQYNLKGKVRPDWVTCSPKENLGFTIADNLKPHELKFIVDDSFNIGTAIRLRELYPNASHWLQPEGNPPTPEHIKRVLTLIEEFPEFRFGGRLHCWIGTR